MNAIKIKIDNLDVSQEIKLALKKAHILDPKKALILSCQEIERQTGLSSKQVVQLKSVVAETFLPHKPCTGLDLLNGTAPGYLNAWKLPTNCPVIDEFLNGGIVSGILTEVSGESASGKTQLCLQLCISAQLKKHKSGGSAYICTEDVFPSKRLQQLIQTNSSHTRGKNLGDGIFIEHVADFEALEFCVSKKLPTLLNRGVVDLVVIDSVAALFRCHYDVTQTMERARHLNSFAGSLQKLALYHNIPFVCVNQVTSSFAGSSSSESSLIPSLGLTWSNQITCRLMLSRSNAMAPDVVEHREGLKRKYATEPSYRKLSVIFAPHLAPAELPVMINNFGMHGVPL